MLSFTDDQPHFDVRESEYLRLLGYPRRHVLEGRARELALWARQWYAENGRPWIFARTAQDLELTATTVGIAGTEFGSERLRTSLAAAEARAAVLVAVSAGAGCEEHARECWEAERPDEYFFLEIFGSAVVESLIAATAARVCAWAETEGLTVLPHYSPGYSGWPISDQPKLWRLVRGNNGSPFPGPLEVLDSGMPRPKKSLLGLFGLTAQPKSKLPGTSLVPCRSCSLEACQYRRAPYRFTMPQREPLGARPEELEPQAGAGSEN